ncbi:hypothetical protein [Halorussus salinisoli]|uniref:hypothetical protein n=1 Tax=Halorussus salinisoli TaxID=2558242 RepID=UPI0010C15CA8|nr:hypothetical protein [Halorussus salinisoli]
MPDIPIVDAGKKWFRDIINEVIGWFEAGLRDGYAAFTEAMFGTPTPHPENGNVVFGMPENQPWVQIYHSLVGGEIMLFALSLLLICVQGRHTLRIFNFSSGYQARKTRKNAWTGAFLIVTWYWVGTLCLYLIDGVTLALMPQFGGLVDAMQIFLQASLENPGLTLAMSTLGGLSMWLLEALFYIRRVLLYIYMYGMPLGVAIAFGNLPVVSDIAKAVCKRFVPLAVMPLPAAILFKGYDLLYTGESALAPGSAFLQYLVAVSLPLLALFITWRLFKYANPAAAKIMQTTSGAALTAGTVVAGAYAAGPAVARTAAHHGPKAAARQVGFSRVQSRFETESSDGEQDHGAPKYRRTENDPGYY